LSVIGGIKTHAMEFPLRHPPFMIREREADRYAFERVFLSYDGLDRNIFRRVRRKLANITHSARRSFGKSQAEA
jgi:hypothetical protein